MTCSLRDLSGRFANCLSENHRLKAVPLGKRPGAKRRGLRSSCQGETGHLSSCQSWPSDLTPCLLHFPRFESWHAALGTRDQQTPLAGELHRQSRGLDLNTAVFTTHHEIHIWLKPSLPAYLFRNHQSSGSIDGSNHVLRILLYLNAVSGQAIRKRRRNSWRNANPIS